MVASEFRAARYFPQAGLGPERGAQVHLRGLGTFGVADRGCHVRDVGGAAERNEQGTVVVAQDEGLGGDAVLAAPCGLQRGGVAWIESRGSSRCGPTGSAPWLKTGSRMVRSSLSANHSDGKV
ncbi:hypothetical protein [Arthrobacter sp. 4R501]|uniref:hypothetical protein n=1 Tax=Arthrobacter sp. 4R501 TaxID=2058886 RepID=UPI000CE39D07|nr:hypothetical protein [Arthrobacter sp. 4R501]